MSINDFSLTINSNSSVSGALNAQKTFYFDFQTRKQGLYEVTTSFLSGANNVSTANLATLGINWPGQLNFATTALSTSSSASSNIAGLLASTLTSATNGYLSAMWDLPTTMWLPPSGQFQVSILDVNGNVWQDSASADIAPYVMCMSFKWIEISR